MRELDHLSQYKDQKLRTRRETLEATNGTTAGEIAAAAANGAGTKW